jgi:hypothetical protein
MAGYGFDYQLHICRAQFHISSRVGCPPAPSDPREFATAYGLGISTDPWCTGTFWDSLWSVPQCEDPNADQVAGMDEGELMAWQRHLATCTQAAQTAQQSNSPWGTATPFHSLLMEITTWHAIAERDPQMRVLESEWADCMADAGYPWRNANEMNSAFHDEFDKIVGFGAIPDEVMSDWGWADGLPPRPTPSAEAVVAFQDRERAAAIADVICRESTDFEVRRRAIEFEIQQQIVDRLGSELEAFAQYAEETGTWLTPAC